MNLSDSEPLWPKAFSFRLPHANHLAFALAILALCGCSKPAETADDKVKSGPDKGQVAASGEKTPLQNGERQDKPRPVRTMTLGSDSDATAATVYPGELRARHESRLGFRAAGKLTARQVQAGDRVAAGQILARLDPSETAPQTAAAKAQLLGAETDLRLAQADLQRLKDLRAKGFVSEAQVDRQAAALDAAKARVEAAQAQLAQAGNNVEFQLIRADAPGVVVGLDAEIGQVIAAGQSVVRVARDGEREALIYLPESKMSALALGQAWLVWLASESAAQAKKFNATVREISPLAEPGTRTFAVRLALRESMAGFPLGISIQAQAMTPSRPGQMGGLRMPATALYSRDGKTYVWKVNESESRVALVEVQVLGFSDQGVRIQAAVHDNAATGLNAGDRVVTAGVNFLREGQTLRWLAA